MHHVRGAQKEKRNEWSFEHGNDKSPLNIVRLLKVCTASKDLVRGSKLHAYIQQDKFLGKNVYIGSTLINMYAKCGILSKAQQVLKELPVRDVVTWSALLAGYAQQGQGEEALKCFDDMLSDGHSPTAITYGSVLKACGSIGAVAKGKEIHDKIVSLGMLEKNIVLGNTLVDMYVKCGALAKAQKVLEQLPIRNAVTWSTIIAGYVQHGQGEQAMKCFDDMLHEGHSPDVVTFVCVLKACGSIRAAAMGEDIHDKIVSLGMLEKGIVLGNTLVDMYVKCGALAKARQVLEVLPARNVVSWSTLIAGYVQQGQGQEALQCFDDMLYEGHLPDAVTFICVLKACGSIGATGKGEEIHDMIVSLGILENDTVIRNTLVDMYAKCGALAKARRVLDELPIRSVVSWSALVAGYVQQGKGEEALKCFDDMLNEGHSPNAISFVCALKACGSIQASAKGQEIHDMMVTKGILDKDIVLGTTLVDMYVKCGALVKAQRVLEELPIRNVVSWSALIAGYSQQGQGEEALKCYDDMLYEGHTPNLATFVCALKACRSLKAVAKGEEIHDKIVSLGILEKEIMLRNALVDMYAKCGALSKAQQVLNELPVRDVVSWNALIAGYAQQGKGEEALKCFNDMLHEGHMPVVATFICVLKACGSIKAAAKGNEIHDKIVNLGMLEKDAVLGNYLVDMYVNCGALAKAHQVLEELPVRNVVTWSAVIAGYAQQGQGEEALKCFRDMLHEGHSPDAVTFVCVLKACGSIGAAAKGEEIHDMIVNLGMLEKEIVLRDTLVDMFAKCGLLIKAWKVLEGFPVQSVVSWNTLIIGYGQQGQILEAINCFERMQSNGVKPNSTTLISMLMSCSHSGLLDEARAYFSQISTKYGIHPDSEHYCCMIDLFSRAGNFNNALTVIVEMPSVKCFPSWVALLSACRNWGEVKIGKLAFEHALPINKSYAALYVLMADIYSAADMQKEANKIEVLRMANKASEKPGCSW